MAINVTPPDHQEWNLPSGSLSFGVIDAERVRMKAYLCNDLAVGKITCCLLLLFGAGKITCCEMGRH